MSKSRKSGPMDATAQQPQGGQTQMPVDTVERDPAMDAPPPEIPESGEGESREKKPKKRVVRWLGPAIPHQCPKCRAVLCDDRLTKACRVITTRLPVTDENGTVQDRDMECNRCHELFIAREGIT